MEEQIAVLWSLDALEMLGQIHNFISENSLKAADKYVQGIYDYIAQLEKHPESCAPCRNNKLNAAGFRCCLFKSHIIVYGFLLNRVEIVAVIHSKINPDSVMDLIN